MTERRVSVRMTAVGGQQVKAELQGIGQAGVTSFERTAVAAERLDRSMMDLGGGGGGLRNASLQLSQVAQQTMATGNFVQALSIQLPDLLLGFGTFGIAAGVAAGALLPFAANLISAGEAASEAADQITRLGERSNEIQGQISGLTDLQERLNDAMRAQADASAVGASATIANTRAEIEVRKQRLALELQLLAVDRRSAQTALENIRAQQANAIAIMRSEVADIQSGAMNDTGLPQGFVRGPGFEELRRRAQTIVGPDALNAGQQRRREILDMQIALFELDEQARKADEAINAVFAGGDVTGGGEGGGTRGRARGAAQAVQEVQEATEALTSANDQMRSSAERAFVDFVTGARSAQEAIGALLSDLARMFAQQAFQSLFTRGGFPFRLPGFANGTSYAPGGLALVGERGPEIVNLPRGSQVFTNEQSRRMAGGTTINISVVGAKGDAEIRQMVSEGVRSGLVGFSRDVLPIRMRQISNDPRRVG